MSTDGGGDIWKGAEYGAISGAMGGGLSLLGSYIGTGSATWLASAPFATPGGLIGGVPGAAGGGALSAIITGGDPGLSAAVAGISTGVGVSLGLGDAAMGSADWFGELAISTCLGAGIGGTVAEIKGGNFWQGAVSSAAYSATGFVISSVLEPFANAIVSDAIKGPLDEVTVKGKALVEAGKEDDYYCHDVRVKAYRLNKLLGFSYAPGPNEVHTSTKVLRAVKAGKT